MIHPLDSAITASISTYTAANTIGTPNIITSDPSGQLSKLIITAIIGVLAPLVQQLLKKLYDKIFPPKI